MKKILLFILILPVFAIAQNNQKWELFITTKKIATGFADKDTLIKVPAKAIGFLKLVYADGNITKNWKRHFLVMDENNQTLLDTSIKTVSGTVSFDLRKLKAVTQKKKFSIYTYSFPKDPQVAATIRVRRMILFTVEWN
jgi:hypothetical protein